MKIDEGVYLEHFGKKAMRWGQKTGKQKRGTAAATVAGALVSTHYLGKVGSGNRNLVVATGGAIIGAKAASSIIKKNGQKKLLDIS